MLNVQTIPALNDNYIWLLHQPDNPAVVVVDPADAAVVLPILEEHDYHLAAILITHHHYDHTGGIADLLAVYPQAQVYTPAKEAIAHTTHALQAGDKVNVSALNCQFEVLDVSGHTRGHIAYYAKPFLFCGDALFTGGCGKIFEGTPLQSYQSLARLAQLPDETLVYCAHEYTRDNLQFAQRVEPDNLALQQRVQATQTARQQQLPTVPSRLGLEKATNPFLRYAQPDVIAATVQEVGHPLDKEADVFAALRAWKDRVDE